jgi:hypothetical protein
MSGARLARPDAGAPCDLAPCCARIQVAGSVRRRKEVVGDIEVVAIPRYVPAGLFGDCTANLLWEHLHASDAYRFTKGDHANGRYVNSASPGTWACSSICSWRSPTTGASRC